MWLPAKYGLRVADIISTDLSITMLLRVARARAEHKKWWSWSHKFENAGARARNLKMWEPELKPEI